MFRHFLSRNDSRQGEREPFVPPGPDAMTEALLLDVRRWVRVRQVPFDATDLVYSQDVNDDEPARDLLFDNI